MIKISANNKIKIKYLCSQLVCLLSYLGEYILY